MLIAEIIAVVAIIGGAVFLLVRRAKMAARKIRLRPDDPSLCPGSCTGCSETELPGHAQCSGKSDERNQFEEIE